MSESFFLLLVDEALRTLAVTAAAAVVYASAAMLGYLLDRCRWLTPPERLMAQGFGALLLGIHLWMIVRVTWNSATGS